MIRKNTNGDISDGEYDRILKPFNDCYLFFIWDFLYNLYDRYSKKVKNFLGNDEFNNKRVKIFENLCYKNLKNSYQLKKI